MRIGPGGIVSDRSRKLRRNVAAPAYITADRAAEGILSLNSRDSRAITIPVPILVLHCG